MAIANFLGTVASLARRALQAASDPVAVFHADSYLRHNQRRQEHLASLGLDLAGASVLEVGAGIGDHTSFFLDRGCRVLSTEARPQNLAILRRRYPGVATAPLDLNAPTASIEGPFDIVYCYGLLYHLSEPADALAFLAGCADRLLLLETCVSAGAGASVNPCAEHAWIASQSIHGAGCRPTRAWVHARLKEMFPFVYLPLTQPWHEEFPLDWATLTPAPNVLTRAIFIASRQPIPNPLLVEELPMHQRRH